MVVLYGSGDGDALVRVVVVVVFEEVLYDRGDDDTDSDALVTVVVVIW